MSGINKHKMDKLCPKCGENIYCISLKSFYIDDCETGCINEKCSKYAQDDIEQMLIKQNRREAQKEYAMDHYE